MAEHLKLGPAVKAHVHRVPRAKVAGQAAPLASIAGHEGLCIQKTVIADAPVAARLG